MRCVEVNYLDELRSILQENVQLYKQDQLDDALHRAAQLNNADACALLIQSGSDVNSLESRERYAARRGQAALCTLTREQAWHENWLLRHSSRGGTALHLAVENAHHRVVQGLVEHGAQINMPDSNGVTSLMLASMRRGSDAIVSLLLESADVDVNATERRLGRTALHYAAEAGFVTGLKMLIEAGTCYVIKHIF